MNRVIAPAMFLFCGASAAFASGGNTPRTFWMPEGASTIAPSIDHVFDMINWVCYFFFALVVIIMFWFMWKYRQRGRIVDAQGPTHNMALELTWTIIPIFIVAAMFFVGFKGFLNIVTPPENSYEIDVVAQKWAWEFKYPNGATSEDLYVPAGQPVKLIMSSRDVLHSLYIKDFRVKQDVIPGRYSYLWFQANEPTLNDDFHWLFCTEYCGFGHSNMNRKVYVLPEDDFAEWVVEQGQWLDKILDEDLYFKAGPKLFVRCVQCHSLDGTPGIGPSWGDHAGQGNIWERTVSGETVFDDGTKLSSLIGPGKAYETPEDYLRTSMLNPGKHLVQGYGNAMAVQALNDRAVDALIGMMKRIDEFDANGKWLKESELVDQEQQ
ncbi:MAG: cytochrome c oxidase subunit II [Phycisphaerae bacterium]|nr:cytochrome c oxidase subunit II [Phycisphaerae bacterium]